MHRVNIIMPNRNKTNKVLIIFFYNIFTSFLFEFEPNESLVNTSQYEKRPKIAYFISMLLLPHYWSFGFLPNTVLDIT